MLNVDEDFYVNIDYEVTQNNSKIGLNVILHDSNQNIISSSSDYEYNINIDALSPLLKPRKFNPRLIFLTFS